MALVRVSPTEPNPTHHVSIRDRDGNTLGLILCDEKGQAKKDPSSFVKNPVETTALKQTSGNSSYDIFDYPYNPIVQDDLSGGRGSIDFERDGTKYYDSFRCKSGRPNKAYLGPQEQYATGLRDGDQRLPGSVGWRYLLSDTRYIYHRFTASASYTAASVWLLLRRKGTPGDITVGIYSDNSGALDTLLASTTISTTDTDDILSEWVNVSISQAITSGTVYWIVIYSASTDNVQNLWMVGVDENTGTTYYSTSYTTTPTSADYNLYFRLTPVEAELTCVPFHYKEAQYFVINPVSGAPSLYLAGDRGTADSNAASLNKLIDGTKSWATNAFTGATVTVIRGPGRGESRTVLTNSASELVVSENWTTEHTTSTEYVLYANIITQITGHGLTAPVTDVLVSPAEVIYFAMGNQVTVRRAKYETSAGVWTATYADETATTKADLFGWMDEAKKIVLVSNYDASGNVSISVMSNASLPTWGTDLTWATAINVDDKYRYITGIIAYPNSIGTETVWIFKEDGIWSHDGGTDSPERVSLLEFENVRSKYAGVRPLHHNVYLYFPLQYGLERYYGENYDDIGPNLGEGLPANRRGPIVSMIGYPGKYFAAIDAGDSGYSSILDSDGWHERYRAPKGRRVKAMAFQTIPGETLDRIWIYQGNDLLYLPMPSETPNELEDANYLYTHEAAVILARMHAGIFDVQKFVKLIKLQTENLEIDDNNLPVCWIELDYRIDGDTEWTTFETQFTESPTQGIDLSSQFGIAGRRFQFRMRLYSRDNSKTPIFLAIVVNAVLRTDVKYMYPLSFRLMDDEPLLTPGENDGMTAQEKLKRIEDWADASTDSMLIMDSVSPLYHNHMIFLNPPTTRHIRFKDDEENSFDKEVFICNLTVQEA